jgi:hypothetical protein
MEGKSLVFPSGAFWERLVLTVVEVAGVDRFAHMVREYEVLILPEFAKP